MQTVHITKIFTPRTSLCIFFSLIGFADQARTTDLTSSAAWNTSTNRNIHNAENVIQFSWPMTIDFTTMIANHYDIYT